MECNETEKFCKVKGTTKGKKLVYRVEKIFSNSTSDRGLVSKIYKNSRNKK